MRVSEIHVKRIRVNQGLGVYRIPCLVNNISCSLTNPKTKFNSQALDITELCNAKVGMGKTKY